MSRLGRRLSAGAAALGIGALVFVLCLLGCIITIGAPPDPGTLEIFVATVPYPGLTQLSFTVKRVEVIWSATLDGEEERIVLSEDVREMNLLGLASITPERFASYTLEPGFVHQLRLVLEDASGTIGQEVVEVKVPSGPQTGEKVIPAEGDIAEIRDQEITKITVSLDVEHTLLHNRGRGYIVKPVINYELGESGKLLTDAYEEGKILLWFTQDATDDDIQGVVDELGGSVYWSDTQRKAYFIQLSDLTTEEADESLRDNPLVEAALPNLYFVPLGNRTPIDPNSPSQWALHNTGQTGGTPDADIDAPEAWDITVGDSSIVVAVIDSGMDMDHPDLRPNRWVNPSPVSGDFWGVDFPRNSGTELSLSGFSDNPHGSLVSGIIGATASDSGTQVGTAGVCWNVQLMTLRCDIKNPEYPAFQPKYILDNDSIYRALTYAANRGVRIVNESFGVLLSKSDVQDMALKAEMDFEWSSLGPDVLHVVSAGNDPYDIDAKTQYYWYPAEMTISNMIVVAMSDDRDKRHPRSCVGPTSVDLAAPGVWIYTTDNDKGWTDGYEGTSFAAPHVSGVAALMLSVDPTLTPLEMKSLILSNVDPVSDWSSLVVTGGRLNAYKAVAAAAGIPVATPPASETAPYPGTYHEHDPGGLLPLPQIGY